MLLSQSVMVLGKHQCFYSSRWDSYLEVKRQRSTGKTWRCSHGVGGCLIRKGDSW